MNVARSKGTPTWPRFKVTASCCDLPQRQYFEDLFNENGGVFLYDKSAYGRIIKKQRSPGKVQKEPEKKGKKEIDGVVCFFAQV